MKLTLRLVHLCLHLGIPWCFENPAYCRTFDTPEWQSIIAKPGVHEVVFDQCSFGTRWRKPTRLVFGCIGESDLGMFEGRVCSGNGSSCSYTGKDHIQLTGSGPGGVPWTRRAQEYPTRLCRAIANTLSKPLRNLR